MYAVGKKTQSILSKMLKVICSEWRNYKIMNCMIAFFLFYLVLFFNKRVSFGNNITVGGISSKEYCLYISWKYQIYRK